MTHLLLDGYVIVPEWIQENKVHIADRIHELLQASQEMDSLTLYRRLCIDLAEHPSPGRMIVIYFVTKGVKKTFNVKNNRVVADRIPGPNHIQAIFSFSSRLGGDDIMALLGKSRP